MRFKSGKDFLKLPSKAVTVLGMSGVGKTTLSRMLHNASWFQYSVDYRIGTRYMDEYIVDNFKREANKNDFLKRLLRSDSIYIRSNITFENLEPLSTYLGKPGNPEKGGISFAEYKLRQSQHCDAERKSLMDVPEFIKKSREIYRYENFICDSGGSLCEVVNPDDENDAVLKALSGSTVMLYIEGTEKHMAQLVSRFIQHPKPMYYQPKFLDQKWAEYKAVNKIKSDDAVDPDRFAEWGYAQLLKHRAPIYKKIADNFGYTVRMQDIPTLDTEEKFNTFIARTIDENQK
jgi:hypothetical protein